MDRKSKIALIGSLSFWPIVLVLIFVVIGNNSSTTKSSLSSKGNSQNIETNEWHSRYSGSYTVQLKSRPVDILNAEIYALKPNGEASWVWVKNVNGKAKREDRKTGTWRAREGFVFIDIRGNTGVITESFQLKEGIFVELVSGNRYLKKVY